MHAAVDAPVRMSRETVEAILARSEAEFGPAEAGDYILNGLGYLGLAAARAIAPKNEAWQAPLRDGLAGYTGLTIGAYSSSTVSVASRTSSA